MKRVSNMRSGWYTRQKIEFRGHNLYGQWVSRDMYVVWSYGEHWPLWVWKEGTKKWYGNKGTYSRTTSKHKSQAWPRGVGPEEVEWRECEELKLMVFEARRKAGDGDGSVATEGQAAE